MAPSRARKDSFDEDDDDDDEMYGKLIAPDDFNDGSVTNRRCTDCLCALLLILVWLVTTAIGFYAINYGDIRLVIHPIDYDGNVCGTDFREDMTDYPYLLYVNSYTGGVCVNECPSLVGQVANNVSDIRTLVTYAGVWQPSYGESELPLDFVQVAPYYVNSSDALFCTDSLCFPDNSAIASWHSAGISKGFGFAYYAGDTYELFWRCYLTSDAERAIQNQTQAEKVLEIPNPSELLLNLYSDVYATFDYVFGFGFGVALGVSFLYVFLMRLPCLLSIMIWGSIGLTWAMFGAAGYFSFANAAMFSSETPRRVSDQWITVLYGVSMVCFVILAILVSITCCLIQQIQMSIGCVRAAARAINRMPGILIVPVLQSMVFIGALGTFAIYGAYLASMGKINVLEFPIDIDSGAEIAVRTYGFDGNVEICAWFLLFVAFWTSNFIVAVGDLTVAMSVARWYFQKEKRRIGSCVVLGSLANTLYYHTGTLAFGSLLIALVQLVRALLERIRRTIKKADNKIANTMICCCQCCFCMLEACLRFMNKNAWIQTAIFGTSFCQSSRQAFYLMLRNAGRVGAVSYVSSSILVVGKVFISTVTTGLSYIALIDAEAELHHVGGPLVIIFFISYIVSDIFMGVFDISIKTILHCFVADEEMFDGEYAEGAIVRFIDTYNQELDQEHMGVPVKGGSKRSPRR
ncbi:Choline transporter-like protein [Seminavis robusta]|uniref:Choline transporter-like protein n=1 Tax=Seminavis robusta TaxID=568900 RepID=A0A9N8DAM3_9STRA|nr:Choline transporter-like protein [Seminavis robusta]|eukprot:Sro17_g012300.1 Choline transporter-like protein (689) ;mRNA; r:74922-76988